MQESGLKVNQPASFAVSLNGAKGVIDAKVHSPSGALEECCVTEIDEGNNHEPWCSAVLECVKFLLFAKVFLCESAMLCLMHICNTCSFLNEILCTVQNVLRYFKKSLITATQSF